MPPKPRPGRAAAARTPARLYLVTPSLADVDAFAGPLAGALDGGDVAAVLCRFEEADERTLIEHAKRLCAVVQPRDVACLIEDHADIVARSGADGAHVAGIAAARAARETMPAGRILGVGGLESRHDAMVAGEIADYVTFGDPGGGTAPALSAVIARIGWWAEIFQVPCVGWAARPEEAAALAEAGADFVALGDGVWNQELPPGEIVRRAVADLSGEGTP
jgi:thiamine-phosphate pyrophosphorylase